MPEKHMLLATEGRSELIVRKSRFLGYALQCDSAAQARRALQSIREEHPKASHYVFSWRIRDAESGRLTHRFSDDGEPGGTAGRPVLQAMESRQVVNAQAVVVRYFGGIKLGAGGLVRAYGETAAKALAAADLRPLVPMRVVTVRLPYGQVSALEHWVARERFHILERRFAAEAMLSLELPVERLPSLERELADLTGGAARLADDSAVGDG